MAQDRVRPLLRQRMCELKLVRSPSLSAAPPLPLAQSERVVPWAAPLQQLRPPPSSLYYNHEVYVGV